MVFNVSCGFQGIELTEKERKMKDGKQYMPKVSMMVADVVIVRESGEAEVLTGKVKKDWDDISYFLGGDDDDEEDEEDDDDDEKNKENKDAKKKSLLTALNTEQYSGKALRSFAETTRADPDPNHKAVSMDLIQQSQSLRAENLSLLRTAEQSQAEMKRVVDAASTTRTRSWSGWSTCVV